jgi:predicted ATPase/DNA-binding CsgD family transcriptional regulator/Tfp pilus assembly protein PilF
VPRTTGARLFGRATELAEIRRLLTLDGVRLLSLVGPGGTGKTRLAETIVSEPLPPPLTEVYYVDLSAVTDAATVASTIAVALGAQEAGSAPLPDIIQAVIGRSPVLLVLDNFERVVAAAGFVAELLAHTPQLSCLITSREPLHIRPERVFQVQPLSVPEARVTDLNTLASSPSVALFVDRASARWQDFALTPENAPILGDICRKLDGLPLAIELAAAQVSVLPPQTILERLDSDAPFVLEGGRDAPFRHRTLATAVAWSYDLLDPLTQTVFRGCGVFNGSFSSSAVAAVVDASSSLDPLPTLAQLADKSLIRPAELGAGEPRFHLLQTIRSFALELLAAANELESTRRKHAVHFLGLAEDAEPRLVGPNMGETLDGLDHEYDNLRDVLAWSVEGGDLELGLRMAGALNRFWMMRGHLSEARAWFERALPLSAEFAPHIRAKAFNTAGVLAGLQGDNKAAEPYFRESYRLWEIVGDAVRMAAAMGNLGLVAQDRQDEARALDCFARAEALYAAAGDRRGVAVSIGSRAHLARQQGNTLEAVTLFQETLALFRECGDPRGIANSLANLGHALIALGQPEASIAYLSEALELRRSLGNTLAVAECFEGFAAAAAARRQGRRAARLLGAAAALRETTGAALTSAERREHEAVVRRIQRLLTPAGYAREQAFGEKLTPDEAADLALGGTDLGPIHVTHGARGSMLSVRELEIARLVTRGLTNRQIAATVSLTPRTVATHLEHIFNKLAVQGRAEVAAWVVRNDLEPT